jgi:hypothetical protein
MSCAAGLPDIPVASGAANQSPGITALTTLVVAPTAVDPTATPTSTAVLATATPAPTAPPATVITVQPEAVNANARTGNTWKTLLMVVATFTAIPR